MQVEYLQNWITLDSSLIAISKHQGEYMFMDIFEFARQGYSFSLEHLEIRLHVHALIAGLAKQHFIQHDSDSPNIAFLWVLVLFVGLWRHVLRRADVVKYLRFVRYLSHFTISKINNSESLTLVERGLEQDVIRLQISMNYMLVFDALVSFQNLPQNDHNFLLRDSVWIISYVICESAALEQLHHEVYVVL